MPLVRIKHLPHVERESVLELAQKIPAIIVRNLHVKNSVLAQLREDDIEVEILSANPDDRNVTGIEIIIVAMDFPERRGNLHERTVEISKSVREITDTFIPKTSGYIWVQLVPSAFVAI